MGFVKRRNMQHRVNTLQAARDQCAVGDRPDRIGERPRDNVEAEDGAA